MFNWSVWVDHASHWLPQMDKDKGEKMEKWRVRKRSTETLRKGCQKNSQGEGIGKTEMWVNNSIHHWEFASPLKYRQGTRGRDYFRLLFIMPACVSGQS